MNYHFCLPICNNLFTQGDNEMNMTKETNTDSSAANWGFWGFVGGTAVAAGATVLGGAPITAWVCTKCLFTGITAGAAALGYKSFEKGERATSAFTQKTIDAAKTAAEKTNEWSQICMWGGISLLGATLSSLNYYTIGKDCNMANQNNYCDPSQKLFYLTSGVCAAATIVATVLGARYLRS